MKRAIYTVAAAILIASLDATAIAQSAQENSADPCATKGGCVVTQYDKFQDRTYAVLTDVRLSSDSTAIWNRLSMRVVYFSQGEALRRPATAGFVFTAAYTDVHMHDKQAFAETKGVYLLIDGKSYPLGDAALDKYEEDYVQKWTYILEVPFSTLELISSGKSVEIRAGAVEFTFDDDLKAAFRRLVELAPKEEPQKPPTAEKKAAPTTKPAQRAPAPRRRRRP